MGGALRKSGRVVPAHVAIVDSAEATTAVMALRLGAGESSGEPTVKFFATDSVE